MLKRLFPPSFNKDLTPDAEKHSNQITRPTNIGAKYPKSTGVTKGRTDVNISVSQPFN